MTFKPYRNTKNDMTFERADRMEAQKHKQTLNFFQDATAALAARFATIFPGTEPRATGVSSAAC